MKYQTNPTRKCGKKKADGFYGEAGDSCAGGFLWPWTWLLGDGIDKTILANVPPRKMVLINPAATIAAGELVWKGDAGTIEDMELYNQLSADKTKSIGVGDHVGRMYTPYNFAQECKLYGPSRKMTEQEAAAIGKLIHHVGPLPIMFTHSEMPIFKDIEQRDEALRLIAECRNVDLSHYYLSPVWEDKNWGQYAVSDHLHGSNNYLVLVLEFLDRLFKDWKEYKIEPGYKEARDFFKGISFVEQPFGLSWLTNISYTLPKDGESKRDLDVIPGLKIIDLNGDDDEFSEG